MILKLKVQNFALIEDLEIELEDKLTVLTGETGTGKTIILEALHLLFGKRSDQTMIRHGRDKALVFGMFKLNHSIQIKYDLPETIEVLREIDSSGRHKISLNDGPITLTFLKQIMDDVGSMHGQNETMQLLDQSSYIEFVDQINEEKTKQLLNNYLILRNNYLEMKNKLKELRQRKDADIEQQEFYQYQLDELNEYNLVENEKEDLTTKINELSHFDTISTNLKEAYQLFEDTKIDNLYEISKKIEKINKYMNDFETSNESVLDAYYNLEEIKNNIFNKIETLNFDENEFNIIQARIFELNRLEEKYKKDITELIAYESELTEKLALITNYDDYIKSYETKVIDGFNKAFNSGLSLSKQRKNNALVLEEALIKELKDLDLPKATIKIIFNEIDINKTQLLETGLDDIDFHISLNEGEPIKPLAKVASGGERARFMFALKIIYARQNNLQLLILDEIDIGISGKTAAMVANKMQSVAKDIQLIVISHLPQVAARADNHYGIYKRLENNRMVTNIKKLDFDDRVETIALMLSDESLSNFAIEQAKRLLQK